MFDFLSNFAWQFWQVSLEAGPWLILGLVTAGLIKAWFPTDRLGRWLGGQGMGPVVRAAVIGTPLPLCSCSVIPAAVTIRRGGASRGATVSFLISTPENGADSIALSYALLGPAMMIIRPVAAIFSAMFAGFLTLVGTRNLADDAAGSGESVKSCCAEKKAEKRTRSCCEEKQTKSCCEEKAGEHHHDHGEHEHCCHDEGQGEHDHGHHDHASHDPAAGAGASFLQRTYDGIRFAAVTLFADLALWLFLGLLAAAAINTFVSPDAMAAWGSGIGAMLLMLLIGVPMYICATASTPVAAAMLIAGVSPGTVLVFLLAGPATNLATVGIVRKELGWQSLVSYLVGISLGAVVCGLITDWLFTRYGWQSVTHAQHVHDMVPAWIAVPSVVLLAGLSLWVLVRALRARFRSEKSMMSLSVLGS